MQFNCRAIAVFMHRQFVRRAWTTTRQQWTTSFVFGGLGLACVLMSPLGIAVFGTDFARWWLAVFVVAVFFGLVGNRFGVERETAALICNQDRK